MVGGNSVHWVAVVLAAHATRKVSRNQNRRLSLLTHPDKNRNREASEAFRKLSEAIRVLSDDEEQRTDCSTLMSDTCL